MSKFLKGECTSCGGHLEFPVEHAGESTTCPHCGNATELLPALESAPSSSIPTKTIIYTAVAVIVLVGGLIGTMLVLNRAKGMAEKKKASTTEKAKAHPPNPFADIAFTATPVKLEKKEGTSLVYAVGSIRSLTNRQRFAVTVEMDIFAADGTRLNSDTNRPSDYQQSMEPRAEWVYRVPVLDKKAASAKLAVIKER